MIYAQFILVVSGTLLTVMNLVLFRLLNKEKKKFKRLCGVAQMNVDLYKELVDELKRGPKKDEFQMSESGDCCSVVVGVKK